MRSVCHLFCLQNHLDTNLSHSAASCCNIESISRQHLFFCFYGCYNPWLIHPLALHLIITITWIKTNSWSILFLSSQSFSNLRKSTVEQWSSTKAMLCPGNVSDCHFLGTGGSGIWQIGMFQTFYRTLDCSLQQWIFYSQMSLVVRLQNSVIEQHLRSIWIGQMAFQADRTFHQTEEIKLCRSVLLGLEWVDAPPQRTFP